MIEYEKIMFLCDGCPYAAEDIEFRKALFEEDSEPGYCCCDKAGGKMAYCGSCDEPFCIREKSNHYNGHKNLGYAYRQQMKENKLLERRKLYAYGYRGSLGTYENGHIKLPRNSKRQRIYKNQTSRRIRKFKGEIPKGGAYRRFLDYWWNID